MERAARFTKRLEKLLGQLSLVILIFFPLICYVVDNSLRRSNLVIQLVTKTPTPLIDTQSPYLLIPELTPSTRTPTSTLFPICNSLPCATMPPTPPSIIPDHRGTIKVIRTPTVTVVR